MMVCLNSTLSYLLFFIFLSIASFKLIYSIGINTVFCPEIEKQSLLSFKKSLKDPHKLLSSWDGEVNCCNWNGVTCSNLTGHVHKLLVQGKYYDGQFPNEVEGLSGKLNPSLLNLKHLKYLDLSLNSFAQTIPSFIGSFAELQYLNLSHAGFHGKIPHDIGNLSSLHTLAFGPRFVHIFHMVHGYGGQLVVDNLEWLSGLSELEYLNLNSVNLSKATNWAQVINTLPSLIQLHLSSCSLDSIAPPNDVNSTSLTFIDLSKNSIQSAAVLRWILQLSSLVFLDLSMNHFEGSIPTSSNATKLQHVDLTYNNFNSSIPDWLYFSKELEFVDLSSNRLNGMISNSIANLTSLNNFNLALNQLSGKIPKEIPNLCKLEFLDLSGNNLQGDIFDVFGNMSECFLGALQGLYLGGNQLSGHLTDLQLGEFKSLEYLSLAYNSLSGAIPINLGKLTSLKTLFLNSNKLIGNIPESLGQLFNLYQVYIDDNMLEGVVTESHFANLTTLMEFSASRNHLTLKVSPNWIPPFQLGTLNLGSWNLAGIGSEAPSWLENQKNIGSLDLSDTGISFTVPSWFWYIPVLNLSHNYLHGNIPYLYGPKYSNPQFLYLSSNRFSGLLPRVGARMSELDLSNNSFSGSISHFLCDMTSETYGLIILHLGGNQLSGELPDCWMRWPSLRYLNLGNNNMSGSIPHSTGYLGQLQSLNLQNNKFSGQIPFSLNNCTDLVKIDLSNNDVDGSLPAWVGTSLIDLRILVLRSNKLSGNISSEICYLNALQILDLSGNNFSGRIPRCVYNFTAMTTKRRLDDYRLQFRYSRAGGTFIESASVATKGSLRQYDTTLSLFLSIDLSRNNVSGDIPKELGSLVELKSLNLSENHLAGLIPESIGDMKQLESLDLSLNSLSGQIPNSLAILSFLNYLNLSYNGLTGRIPKSTQILSFGASSFIGNNLCGPPLTRNCSQVHENREETEDDKPEIEWFYVLLCLGYAVGFSGVCTTLVLKKTWRDAYFGLLECIWDKVYVFVSIKWIRLSKPSGTNS